VRLNMVIYNKCIKCNEEKPLWEFKTDKREDLGVKNYCKECWPIHKEEQKIIKEKDRILKKEKKLQEKIIERQIAKEERDKEREKKREVKIALEEQRKLKSATLQQERILKAKEKEKKLLERKKEKDFIIYFETHVKLKRKNTRPKEILDAIKLIRTIVFSQLSRKKCTSLKNKKDKLLEAEKILGCTLEEFKVHIEQQFEDWMNWNNHGVYTGFKKQTWHFDHYIPLASAKTIEEIIKLNHYSNIKPLDSYINCKLKKAKLPEEFKKMIEENNLRETPS